MRGEVMRARYCRCGIPRQLRWPRIRTGPLHGPEAAELGRVRSATEGLAGLIDLRPGRERGARSCSRWYCSRGSARRVAGIALAYRARRSRVFLVIAVVRAQLAE